jgi:hypothetical protein
VRKSSLRWIDDDAGSRKGNSTSRSDLGSDVGFHIDRNCARPGVQQLLSLGIGGPFVHPQDVGVRGVGKPFTQGSTPRWIGRKKSPPGDDPGCNHPITRSQAGRQPACDSKADDPATAACDRRLRGGGEAFSLAADSKYPGACSDACLHHKQRNGGNAPGHEVGPSPTVTYPPRGILSQCGGAFRYTKGA